tara:strand:+ start:776 stop:2053 length:1278 start_codon:yes stop_codon:yes gene_type:complete
MASGQKQHYISKQVPPSASPRTGGNPGGTTLTARSQADTTSLGGKKATVVEEKVSGHLNRRKVRLVYPLHNDVNHPAKIKFTAYKVDAYTIDPKALAEIFDVPLLGWGNSKAMTIKDAKAKAKNELKENRVATSSGYDGVDDFGNEPEPRTATVGGSVNPFEVERAVMAKNAEATADARNGANIPDTTNVKATPADGVPIMELYFPQSLTFNDDVNYNQVDLGPAGLSGLAAINNGKSLLNAVGKGISEGVESIFNLARGTLSSEAAQVAGARAAQFIPKEGLRAAITTATQTGINPGTRLLFDKPNIRQFSFTFKLIATSAQEASQIEAIIKTFRMEMYPETINIGAGIPAGYTFPNLFKIEFNMRGANMKVPALQYCYLRSAQASYNATSMTFHDDGHPTEVDLTLVFQEYRALSKQDIQGGY